jgi:hypothetical protein
VSLTKSAADLLAVIGTAAGGVGILVAVLAHLRLRRMRRDYSVLQAGDSAESFVAAAARQVEAVARLRAEVSAVERRVSDLRLDLADALRHVAVVRYDAFRDMGGRMSFSAALLDDAGDGLVITAIHGRTETRSYAKGVKSGNSDQQLSPEERQAITFAMRPDVDGSPATVAGHAPAVAPAGAPAGVPAVPPAVAVGDRGLPEQER